MSPSRSTPLSEPLEPRRLFAWSSYAQLVNQDDAASAYSNITGKGVTVAVIDTGIDYNRAELGGGIGANKKVLGGYDFYANDTDPMDASGHGTNVASVIAASPYTVGGVTYQGVAPQANLVALRVGTESNISDNNIERALQWVIANRTAYNISIVNMSLGSGNYTNPESDFQLSDELATLRDLGVFIVAASGNSNDAQLGPISTDGVAWPAADPSVFAVGAVDSSDIIASWVQRGDELDLLAPGVDIVMLNRGSGTVAEDGTSFASPYVAGAAALIKQADPSASGRDIGSILMTSGKLNRDGDGETGNTTTHQFSRLDISAALALTAQRKGKYTGFDFGRRFFDTALDSQGILHAAWYTGTGDLYYATRDSEGLWSGAIAVDTKGDVGAQPSIAVDNSGKVGIGYFDVTNTAVKYASFNGVSWSTTTIESNKHVGTSPSFAFDIDGNGYLAYYKRSGGDLRLATLDRDANTWQRRTVDGAGATDVGADLSLDVGEAALRGNFGFTIYDTTVAVAYTDSTNGSLKYARLDLDDPTATWFVAVVDDTSGVNNVDLNLYADDTQVLRATIAYQDTATADVRFAYRNTDWFVESVATTGKLGDTVQLFFDTDHVPKITYYDRTKRALYTSTRLGIDRWTKTRTAASSGLMTTALNERSGEAYLTYLNRPRTTAFSTELI